VAPLHPCCLCNDLLQRWHLGPIYSYKYNAEHIKHRCRITAMNCSLGGGQSQGILIGWPMGPSTPSQSPVPDGLRPAVIPNCGIRSEGTSRFMYLLNRVGVADTDETTAERAKIA
jgi:hypothetical protein